MQQKMIKCAVLNCETKQSTGMHKIPDPEKNFDRFRTWLAACGNKKLLKYSPKQVANMKICHLHFEQSDFHGNRLTKYAVPKLNLPESITPSEEWLNHIEKDSINVEINFTPQKTSWGKCTFDEEDSLSQKNQNLSQFKTFDFLTNAPTVKTETQEDQDRLDCTTSEKSCRLNFDEDYSYDCGETRIEYLEQDTESLEAYDANYDRFTPISSINDDINEETKHIIEENECKKSAVLNVKTENSLHKTTTSALIQRKRIKLLERTVAKQAKKIELIGMLVQKSLNNNVFNKKSCETIMNIINY